MNRASGAVLAMACVAVLAGCAKHVSIDEAALDAADTTDKLIAKTVLDPIAAERSMALTHEAAAEIVRFFVRIDSTRNEMLIVLADYDATREDADPFLDRMRAIRFESYEKMLDLEIEARDYLTPTEWTILNAKMVERNRKHVKGKKED